MNDTEIVERQLNRVICSAIQVVRRCAAGFPLVTQNTPVTFAGAPFPTLYWLTCPSLRVQISRLEGAGYISVLQSELEHDFNLSADLRAGDQVYRSTRNADPHQSKITVEVGIGGARNVLKLKCLHAHAADFLAQGLNPIGKRVLDKVSVPDDCLKCGYA